MKYYQDTITGEMYAFDESCNVEEYMKTSRNTPKTLTTNIREKPSDAHVWHKGNWIHEKNKPMDYEEPISEIPCYDPAWITFLFEPLVIISKNKDDFVVTLDEIQGNLYDTGILSKFVAKLKDYNEKSQLDILVTFDGSILLPIDENYNTAEKALDKFNEIIGALFLGGTLVKPIDFTKLLQGDISKNGGYNQSCGSSINSDIRHKRSHQECVLHPYHIKVEEFIEAYNFGIKITNKVKFSPIFLALGYHYLNHGKVAESLSSLWIVIEQLTDFLYENKINASIAKIIKRVLPQKIIIESKHKILHETHVISEQIFQILSNNRKDRNKLLHDGITPNRENIIKL